jgi:hypothetical protein
MAPRLNRRAALPERRGGVLVTTAVWVT